jgi:hypothetical protein
MVSGVEQEEERLRWAATAGSLSVRGLGGIGAQARRDELTDALAGALR